MATRIEPSPSENREPLSQHRVLHAAVALADREGLSALTMRRLAEELGVEAMSLYYHVANKEALLDGVVEMIVAEIEDQVGGFNEELVDSDWAATMRRRILDARAVMLQHPWAPAVFETRTSIGPSVMRYFNSLLGIFRQGGFSYDVAHHGMHALGSRALGFTQELFNPDPSAEEGDGEPDRSETETTAMAAQYPYLIEMLGEVAHDDPDSTLGWCDDQTEFEFGLDLILDGLDRLLTKD